MYIVTKCIEKRQISIIFWIDRHRLTKPKDVRRRRGRTYSILVWKKFKSRIKKKEEEKTIVLNWQKPTKRLVLFDNWY